MINDKYLTANLLPYISCIIVYGYVVVQLF